MSRVRPGDSKLAAFTGMVRLIDDTASLPASVEFVDGCLAVATGGTELGRWSFSELSVEERPGGFLVTVEGEQLLVSPLDRRGFSAALDAALSRHAAAAERERRRRSRLRRRRRAETAEGAPAEPPALEHLPEPDEQREPEESAVGTRVGRWWRRRDLPPVPGDAENGVPTAQPPVSVERPPAVRVEAAPTETQGGRDRRRWMRVKGRGREGTAGRPESEPAPARGSAGGRLAGLLDRVSLRQRLAIGAAVAVVLLAIFVPNVLALALLAIGGAGLLVGTLAFLDPYTAVRIPAPWTAQRLMALGGAIVVVGIVVPLIPI